MHHYTLPHSAVRSGAATDLRRAAVGSGMRLVGKLIRVLRLMLPGHLCDGTRCVISCGRAQESTTVRQAYQQNRETYHCRFLELRAVDPRTPSHGLFLQILKLEIHQQTQRPSPKRTNPLRQPTPTGIPPRRIPRQRPLPLSSLAIPILRPLQRRRLAYSRCVPLDGLCTGKQPTSNGREFQRMGDGGGGSVVWFLGREEGRGEVF
jgi:hypothetical protein